MTINQRASEPVTLLKCPQFATFPAPMSDERKEAVRNHLQDERAGWPMEQFHSIPSAAQHEDVFEGQHVGQVLDILERVLAQAR